MMAQEQLMEAMEILEKVSTDGGKAIKLRCFILKKIQSVSSFNQFY